MNKKLKRILKNTVPLVIYLVFCFAVNAYAEDMWEVANRIIVDVYNKIAGISTVLAALMTTICVVGVGDYQWYRRIFSVCQTSFGRLGNDTVSQ